MEEEEHRHHAFGHHETGDKREQKNVMYWGLGIAAAGLVLTVLFFSSGNKNKSSTNTVVQPSTPFIPNPTDVSIGSHAAPLFWPGLPTSGTPTLPKTHHHGDTDDKKKEKYHSHTTPNDHKNYGQSPTGDKHGHTVTTHSHNPVVHAHERQTKWLMKRKSQAMKRIEKSQV